MTLLQSKPFSTVGRDFHHETRHIFVENVFVINHNQKLLEAITNEMCVVPAIDILPKILPFKELKKH